MFQILKNVLILDKEKLRRYKIMILYYFIY